MNNLNVQYHLPVVLLTFKKLFLLLVFFSNFCIENGCVQLTVTIILIFKCFLFSTGSRFTYWFFNMNYFEN